MINHQTLGTSAGRFLHLLAQSKPLWMGILNVTPDSFSDGGCYVSEDTAIQHAKTLIATGAHIIDVGGASTRPGAPHVDFEEECHRVLPILKKLRSRFGNEILLSLDSYSPTTSLRAAEQGVVDILNDVYAARRFETVDGSVWNTARVAAKFQLGWIGMHMQGTPSDMQANPHYENCVAEVSEFLKERIGFARAEGVEAVVVDPGIGFGKRVEDNLALLSKEGMAALCWLGVPVLIGLSRKRFLTHVHPELATSQPVERDKRSKEWEALAVSYGAKIIRTHSLNHSNA